MTSILSQVRRQHERYTTERGERPVGLLIHPLDRAKADIEAWERAEREGRYGMPGRLSHVRGIEILEDTQTAEGEMRLVSAAEYEAIVGERLEEWKRRVGM